MAGVVSDADFNSREGYSEERMVFQEKDALLVDGHETTTHFLNIYDMDYHALK
jgi:hypothetical protein